MVGQSLLYQIDSGIDIAKVQSLLRRELQLPADTLLGKKNRPATLPGVGLRRGGKIVIKIQTELRLIAPLMQVG